METIFEVVGLTLLALSVVALIWLDTIYPSNLDGGCSL